MKILPIIILLSCIGISYTVAQRRQQTAAEVQPDSQSNPVVATRSRGRARFVKTPEFEQVSSDYAVASRDTGSEGRSEGKSRLIVPTNNRRSSTNSIRRQYEVEEHVDDIPDRRSVYHRPRVITEDKFELPNAPRSKLFEVELPISQTQPEQIGLEDLIKNFGSLHSDEPTKLELPQLLPQVEYETDPSILSSSISSSTTHKAEEVVDALSSTTEKEMQRELLKKDQSTKRPESNSSSTTIGTPRRTIIRSRTNPQRQPPEATSTSASVRSRGRTKSSASGDSVVSSDESTPRGSFRVGRRRPTPSLKDRGPSVIEEDSQSPKTRTGRDSNVRRGLVRNTTTRPAEEPLEPTIRNRADIRRSRGRKFDTPITTERISYSNNKPTEFVSRRTRTRAQPIVQPIQEVRASPRIDLAVSSRSFQEPIRSRNQPETPVVLTPTRDTSTRSRQRSRFQLGDLEQVKLEVEPQQSIEHSTRAVVRSRTARTRTPLIQNEELIASSTVENPIRVTLPSTSTIRSVNAIPMRIKETVQSEVSEVISRKVMRRKRPEPKTSKKSQEVEDDLDELNYPPQFKAIILANKSKEERKIEDVDNDLAPTRPTRRRFSVSTRKPGVEPTNAQTRKPKTLPTRKFVANPDPEKIAKFHARFNNQYQRNNTRNNDDSHSNNVSSTITTTTKRTTKAPSRIPYSRKPSDKLTERKFQQIPTKTNRYSSRYRSETRSSVPTRAATSSPVYVPTVPTVTPGPVTSPHQDDTWSETEPWFMSIINQ